jgi:undecaprenyl-diphosphatase
VVGTPIGDADLSVTSWFADHRASAMDAVATVGSALADTFTVLGVLIGAVTMLAAAGRFRHGLFLVVAVATEFSVFLATSYLIGRGRPNVEPLGEVPSTGSYPSGHVAVAIALYGGLAIVAASITGRPGIGRIGGSITTALALFVGAARLYEGVHHPIDVLGGGLLGVTALLSAAWAFRLEPVQVTDPESAGPHPAKHIPNRTQAIER